MRLPTIQGTIRRRILANFRVDPLVMQKQLPGRFTPKLHNGFAVAGICMIRLEHIRPKVYSSYFLDETKFPKQSVEFDHALIMRNVAHEWQTVYDSSPKVNKEGVLIGQRAT